MGTIHAHIIGLLRKINLSNLLIDSDIDFRINYSDSKVWISRGLHCSVTIIFRRNHLDHYRPVMILTMLEPLWKLDWKGRMQRSHRLTDILGSTSFKFHGIIICSDLRFILNPSLKHSNHVLYAANVPRRAGQVHYHWKQLSNIQICNCNCNCTFHDFGLYSLYSIVSSKLLIGYFTGLLTMKAKCPFYQRTKSNILNYVESEVLTVFWKRERSWLPE